MMPDETSFKDFALYQERAGAWVNSTFGERSLKDRGERARRVLEEAVELAQAAGLGRGDAEAVLADVYARQPGDVGQEVGGLMNTLGALCAGLDVDLAAQTEAEMVRVERPEIVGKCRRKNADKTARGVSDCGIRHNEVVIGGTTHPVSQAYAEGVQACRGGQRFSCAAPYPWADPRRREWLLGYANTEAWDHRLADGTDVLDEFPDGRAFIAPHEPAPAA